MIKGFKKIEEIEKEEITLGATTSFASDKLKEKIEKKDES